jgi:hypothetical protein
MGALNEAAAAMHRDAYTRLADAYLRDGQIEAAIRQFNYCIHDLQRDVDYARYQLAICYGIQRNNERKRLELSSLVLQEPSSDYRMYALMELAMTCYQEFSFDSALVCIDLLRRGYPRHRFAFVAMNLQGSVYLEQEKDSLAMSVFEEVIRDAAGLPEAKDALFELVEDPDYKHQKKDLLKTHDKVIRVMKHLCKEYDLDLKAIKAFNTKKVLSKLDYLKNETNGYNANNEGNNEGNNNSLIYQHIIYYKNLNKMVKR